MKFYCKLTAVFTLLLAVFAAPAADKLAVAEPVNKGGISASDIEAFWGILESSINSDEYTLISRGALKQMLTEIGLTENSDLVNLNSAQRARMGEVEGVKYILVSEVGKFGTRINCTMRIVDATTGEIDTARTANLRVRDLDELADKIEATLDKLLSDDKELMMSAILMPNLQIAKIPDYLAETFNIRLESGLLAGGVRLQNLRSVAKILRDNNLDGLYEMEPKMFRKVGGLLEVQYLIQATITRFEIVGVPYYVSETGAKGYNYTGYLEGFVRVVSAQDGSVTASFPFTGMVTFQSPHGPEMVTVMSKDYGKMLIDSVIASKILPELLRIPELRGR